MKLTGEYMIPKRKASGISILRRNLLEKVYELASDNGTPKLTHMNNTSDLKKGLKGPFKTSFIDTTKIDLNSYINRPITAVKRDTVIIPTTGYLTTEISAHSISSEENSTIIHLNKKDEPIHV